jgi:general secretion pathway protein G
MSLQSRNKSGFTLLELMVVLLILALLGSIAAPRVTKYLSKAKSDTAALQVNALSAAVESFYLDTGRYPTNEEGLGVLVTAPVSKEEWDGPYIQKKDSLTDPWKRPFRYKVPGKASEFDVFTLGADGVEGGQGDDRDLGNW